MAKRMKFDSIKSKIIATVRERADVPSGLGALWLSSEPFKVLAHMAINADSYILEERPALCELARSHRQALQADPDYLATAAAAAADNVLTCGKAARELCLVALKAREEAVAMVERWDVRAVGSLIKLFPTVFPKALQGAAIRCYIEDSEDSPWVVEFTTARSSGVAACMG